MHSPHLRDAADTWQQEGEAERESQKQSLAAQSFIHGAPWWKSSTVCGSLHLHDSADSWLIQSS